MNDIRSLFKSVRRDLDNLINVIAADEVELKGEGLLLVAPSPQAPYGELDIEFHWNDSMGCIETYSYALDGLRFIRTRNDLNDYLIKINSYIAHLGITLHLYN